MEPPYRLHFTPHTVTVDDGGEPQVIETCTPVASGTVLVTLAKTLPPELTPQLICGPHCELQDDHTAIARVAGYPQFTEKTAGKKRILHIDIDSLIQLSSDNMLARIILQPSAAGPSQLNAEAILAILREHGIACGIDDAVIRQCETLLNGPPFRPTTLVIARGVMPVNGHDSCLRFEVEIGPIPGTFLKDGTIDYRERKVFVGVTEHQIIATKVRETSGTPGKDIYGHTLPAVSGRDVPIKLTGDVAYREENRQVVATHAGVLSVVNDNEIKVCARQIIDGDVDFSVGNLSSEHSIQIKGSIQPSFSVRTRGDLLLEGNVYAATINSHGNVVIRGGVLEEKASVFSGGDIDVGFVERGSVSAGGIITIRRSAYYGRITSERDIICSPECRFVGSVAQAGGSFTATNIGSPQAEGATIIAGVDRRRFERYTNLQQKLKLLHTQLERLENTQGEKLAADKKYLRIRASYQQAHDTLIHSNLCPEGPDRCGEPQEIIAADSSVTILGTIYAGTTLRIGNFTTTLRRDYQKTQFQIDPSLKTIFPKEIR